jgi:hypothetical protein
MAAAAPTTADLQALILQLQTQVTTLTLAAAPTASGSAAVVFADTPQSLHAEDLIDYSTKQGSGIYEQESKTLDDKELTDGFGMTPNQMVVFVESLTCRATAMGWNVGSKQITTFTNRSGKTVDIIKEYGQINELTLKTACKHFCKAGEVDVESWAKQNNTMLAIRLGKSLTADAQARLLTYRNEYTFDCVEYAPLMYKIIMRLATINTVATMQTLRNYLNNLGVFAATVSSSINKINGGFDKNYTQLLTRSANINNPVGLLFDAYHIVPCYNFKMHIRHHYNDYLDDKLINLTHEALMTSAMCKYDWLRQKGQWGAKSPDNEKIVAMAAQLNALKGHLKVDKHLQDTLNDDKKTWNKKNKGNKNRQKEEEVWKKIPLKDGNKKSKEVGKHTYHWCEYHMAWCMHLLSECHLGKQCKEEQRPTVRATSATYAAAVASIVNPQFQALIASIAGLQGRFNKE